MAGFSKIPHGKVVQLEGLFANMGEDVADLLIREPKRVYDWIGGLSNELTLPPPPVELRFSTTKEVFDAFHDRCYRRGWPIDSVAIHQFFEKSRELADYQSSLTRALVPDIWLGNLQHTVGELWHWVHDTSGGAEKCDELTFDSEHLRLVNPEHYGNQPSVRWVEVDLTANHGRAPKYVRNQPLAGLQLLTVAAVHSNWAKAIDNDAVPGVNLGGLRARLDAWQYVPYLSRDVDTSKLWLYTRWVANPVPNFSVPVCREL